MVKFKNFRSKWQGVTESNLERVLSILKAMSPVAVMIDEADAFLGDRDQDGDSGVSNRVFSQIASFMGNTEYRGKIIWFLITCRPDLLPIDLKRQGRAEEHLALFYPETDEEKIALFETLVRKLDLSIRRFPVGELLKKFTTSSRGPTSRPSSSGPSSRPRWRAATFVTKEDMDETMADFVPPGLSPRDRAAEPRGRRRVHVQGDGPQAPAEPQPDQARQGHPGAQGAPRRGTLGIDETSDSRARASARMDVDEDHQRRLVRPDSRGRAVTSSAAARPTSSSTSCAAGR